MKLSAQIRAVRGALGWTREELASASDLSVAGIQAIETDKTDPTTRTISKISRALEKEGYFLTSNGIEYQEYPVYFTYGDTHEKAYLKLLDDAYEHLKTVKNPELLIMYSDDKVSPPSVNSAYKKMRGEGIKMRQLIEEGNNYIIGPLEEYRYIPKGFFANRVTLIYGNRIANETADVLQGIVRVDPLNAEIQRNTFNMLWSILKQPKETTANERFE